MRKLLLLLLLVAVAAIALYRQRLFLRDPLGKVLVDGNAMRDAHIFINYSNDVLMREDGRAAVLVQGWDRMPGRPEELVCWRELACLTNNDHAPKTVLGGKGYNPETVMGSREVSYRNETAERVQVILR